MENKENILKKLQKLQKLYESAKKVNSEGEAEAAAAAIQRLLTLYNISIEEIGDEDENKIIEESVDNLGKIGGSWESRMISVICKYNYCTCFRCGGNHKKMMIIGDKENINVVKWMKDYLFERFFELGKQRYSSLKKSGETVSDRDTFLRSYLMGCASGLDSKLKEEREKMEKEKEVGEKVTALVLKKDAEVNEYVKNKYNLVYSKLRMLKNTSAMLMGYHDGKNVELNKAIDQQGKKKLS